MIPRSCILAAALGLWGAAVAQSQGPGLYLFQIPTNRIAADAGPLGDTVQIDLHVPNSAQLVRNVNNTTLAVVAVEEELVRIIASEHDTLTGEPRATHWAPSFVIDFEEASVEILVKALQSAYEDDPSIDELIEFVDLKLVHKTFRRGFDLASQAASSQEGDCTEHAVLLAALARATGRAARVVLGIMLVNTPTSLLAFGHAWTEIHDGEGWRVADATRPEAQRPGARPHYVPLMELTNEGPGYVMQVLELMSVYPVRIAAQAQRSGQ